MVERLHDGGGLLEGGGHIPVTGHAEHAVRAELPIVFNRIVAGLVIGFYDDAFDVHCFSLSNTVLDTFRYRVPPDWRSWRLLMLSMTGAGGSVYDSCARTIT